MEQLDDEGYPVDNSQAYLETRLVDLLSESSGASICADPIYEACIFAAFLCTYKLSTGIWEGHFVPEFCVSQVLRLITESAHDPRWNLAPGLLLWLLFVSGGLTERKDVRSRAACWIRTVSGVYVERLLQDWELLKDDLKKFVWSERAMERKVFRVWEELHCCPQGQVV